MNDRPHSIFPFLFDLIRFSRRTGAEGFAAQMSSLSDGGGGGVEATTSNGVSIDLLEQRLVKVGVDTSVDQLYNEHPGGVHEAEPIDRLEDEKGRDERF